MNARSFIAPLGLSLLLAGCELLGLPTGGGSQEVITSSANEPFEIEIGQRVILEGLNAEIRFVALPEDSRCPEGVACVWSGRVRAAFNVVRLGTEQSLIFVGFVGGEDGGPVLTRQAAGLNIELRALAPYPVYDSETGRSTRGRVATLVVTE